MRYVAFGLLAGIWVLLVLILRQLEIITEILKR